MSSAWQAFADWGKNLKVELTPDKLDKFQKYHQLLLEWNRKMNLVSRQDVDRIISYHFIDSISAITEIPENSVVCDLGTGAGLPGIPIAIVRDDIKIYLVESIKKKALFLSETIKTLRLENTVVLNQRAETIKDIKFDVILIRLFGKIPDVLPLVSRLLSARGKIIFYKIKGVEKEIEQAEKTAHKLHLQLSAIKDILLPTSEILRKLVIYRLIKKN